MLTIFSRRLHWNRLTWPLIAGTVVASVIGSAFAAGWRINVTPSEPVGVYRMTPVTSDTAIHRGDLISFCPPVNLEPFMVPGSCPNGGAPFLKEVVGLPGDVVDVMAAGVTINGRMLPLSEPIAHPRLWPGLTLPMDFGMTKLGPGQYWTYGSGLPKYSFDSRNWGVVERAEVLAVERIS
ncbi:putative Type IV secretory pathway, protease TraF [Thiomonas sp. X19]|uniref:S26 family signal peptidase n=1 Tax=Thiomonas sp. X19 TaxID=1050370 RepID=UPI000B6B68F7|nr:S26 family signal peptidase [Thiomonas sp. X19]SCC93536.1 putative Type IV secretory pathway, protease TraF [Thiomonas sp. X19]